MKELLELAVSKGHRPLFYLDRGVFWKDITHLIDDKSDLELCKLSLIQKWLRDKHNIDDNNFNSSLIYAYY